MIILLITYIIIVTFMLLAFFAASWILLKHSLKNENTAGLVLAATIFLGFVIFISFTAILSQTWDFNFNFGIIQ